MLSTFDLTVPT